MKIILCILLASSTALCQKNIAKAKQSTTGNCSPIVTGNNNTFNFQYCGNDPEQAKKMVDILNAVSESKAQLNAVIEVIKPPNIRFNKLPEEISLPSKHSAWSIEFFIDRADENAQYGVVCDGACNPESICTLPGPNSAVLGHLANNPNVAVFLFERQLPALWPCRLTVESADDKPIKVIGMKHLSITDARMIVLNEKQPPRCVVTGGGSMMC